MADLGSFTFLPWLRRGIAGRIARVEGEAAAAGADPARVAVPVAVTLNDTLTRSVPLVLLGPGDVTGVDRDAIVRIFPTPDAFDVESNYFPLLEIDQPDFPWRYTPARAGGADRLTPWVCLAVLRDDEIETLADAHQTGGLAAVTVADTAALPSWDQIWAWAHVQVSGAKGLAPAELFALVQAEPQRAVSRLLCPRRLEPNTAYTAFLIPTFERGRLAGLGLPVPDDLDALTPAWRDVAPIQLPVYFRWRFGTGAAGDFEFLVRQLEARKLPPTVGKRDLDVSDPGESLPPAFERPLGLEGALSGIDFERTDWNGPTSDGFRGALAKLLDLPADRLADPDADRAVVPPLYGRWHARAERLVPGAPPIWFDDLNQDPRERVAAGVGTRVIQQQQRQLMAGAWAQVQGIREANERLRLTQLARELATRVYDRHLPRADAEELLQVASPVLTRILASPTTIKARLLQSPVLPGATEGQLRRIARPRGPVGRRQKRTGAGGPWRGFSRMNAGELRGPGRPVAPDTLVTPRTTPPAIPPAPSAPALARLRTLVRGLALAGGAALVFAVVVAALWGVAPALVVAIVGAGLLGAARGARAQLARGGEAAARAQRAAALASGKLAPAVLDEAATPPAFVPAEAPPGTFVLAPPAAAPPAAAPPAAAPPAAAPPAAAPPAAAPPAAAPPAAAPSAAATTTGATAPAAPAAAAPDAAPGDGTPTAAVAPAAADAAPAAAARTTAATAFRTAARAMVDKLADPLPAPAVLTPVVLDELRTKIDLSLDPRVTIVAGLRDRLRLPTNARQPTADAAEPVMAAPTFPQPMYEPLAALSQQWMLPGLEQVPPNTVTMAVTNQRFIEAYMVGLNHEMARELQWNGYPTDMRGTYFQRFWDTAGSEAGPIAAPPDIAPIDGWTPASTLGAHAVRPPPPGAQQHLVLLIRGDLFRRYPNTQVYAAKAVLGGDGLHQLGDEELLPEFGGRIAPDVTFFGFKLTAADARGEPSPSSPNQGWFFVIQEHPSEPKFGLDVPEAVGGRPTTWSDLSWGQLALDDGQLAGIRYIDLAAPLPDTSQVTPTGGAHWHLAEGARASDLAFITLQQPMRVAVHGADMIAAPQS